ncbi:MAG: FprA family A-type flavoprotein [Eubacteriales bacterium]|nr:FprA family A-type flavoprotein [Bacillota bacterium]MBV1726639.1 FprA family A-type flavoprotein [Desulforudis sp.]MDQ7790004.1 FprA family A-type flavoprotein [Clostridia bacterium]MDZ4042821.1 FprA family A-type flavoprotein [Eubacteriales bacterium]MBU4553747.1 FprA family A-type flavoprotein [Bacillota bacterium]
MVLKAIGIAAGIDWVGVRNPDLRVFDIVMHTEEGTTYNAYLVRGEKTALIETVKLGFLDEMLERISSITELSKIDYIVLNHTEPDHSGSLGLLLDLMPQVEVLGSRAAIKFASQIINREFRHRVVADGEELDLGGRTLRFLAAPFLHWPDSIFTYVPESKVLFSCDAFGTHHSGEGLFDDRIGDFGATMRYYYDVIISPFRSYMLSAIAKIRPLDIEVIAPSHGPVLRTDPWRYVDLYEKWAREASPRETPSVAVVYSSAYGYTRALAEEIAAGIRAEGIQADLIDAQVVPPGEVAAKIEAADGVLVGSPTFNRDAVPPIWFVLAHVSVITNRGKPAAAFGSYGWSGEAVKLIEQRLTGLQLKVVEPGLRVNFAPTDADRSEAREFGSRFAGYLAK